eukprot:9279142-Lingulodinium_polyedra.AAC.1
MGTSCELHDITRVLQSICFCKELERSREGAIQRCKGSKSSAAPSTKEQRQPLGYARANP